MNAKSAASLSRDQMESDVQRVISGAEDMLEEAASSSGEKAAELRGRALEQLSALRKRMYAAQETVVEKSKLAARATDDYVHDHPWRSMAAAASVGVLIGLLLNRR